MKVVVTTAFVLAALSGAAESQQTSQARLWPGVIVSVAKDSIGEVWSFPDKTRKSDDMDPQDVKTFENLMDAIQGGKQLPSSGINKVIRIEKTDVVRGQMEPGTVAGIQSKLVGCKYQASAVFPRATPDDGRLVFVSVFNCGKQGWEDDAFLTVVIKDHSIQAVNLQPDGPIAVRVTERSDG